MQSYVTVCVYYVHGMVAVLSNENMSINAEKMREHAPVNCNTCTYHTGTDTKYMHMPKQCGFRQESFISHWYLFNVIDEHAEASQVACYIAHSGRLDTALHTHTHKKKKQM